MKISAVRTRVVSAPYARPFEISSGTSPDLHSVVVEVDADGITGTGEASPMTAYTGETLAGVRAAVDDHLAPAVTGRDPRDMAGAHLAMDAALRGQQVAKAAVDIALHDLAGRLAGLPVHLLLGGRVRDVVDVAWVVGLGPVDEVVAEAVDYAGRGFRHLKVKGGPDPARDLTLIRELRSALPAGVELSLDANEGYRPADALPLLERMAAAGLDMVEQPLPHWDLDGMARLRARLPLRVMADESVRSAHDVLEVVRRGAADIVNIKVLKVGGLYPACQAAAVAAAAGLEVKVGSMPELGVATLAGVHLAAAVPAATVPVDAVGPLMVTADPLTGDLFAPAARTGRFPVPTTPGLGLDHGPDLALDRPAVGAR